MQSVAGAVSNLTDEADAIPNQSEQVGLYEDTIFSLLGPSR